MSWWFGKDDDDRWGRQQTRILLTWSGFVGKIWPHKVLGHKSGACFFHSCDEQNVTHTHTPKLTWIPKMVVWKRWPVLKYGHFLVSILNFWGVYVESNRILEGVMHWRAYRIFKIFPETSTNGEMLWSTPEKYVNCVEISNGFKVKNLLTLLAMYPVFRGV